MEKQDINAFVTQLHAHLSEISETLDGQAEVEPYEVNGLKDRPYHLEQADRVDAADGTTDYRSLSDEYDESPILGDLFDDVQDMVRHLYGSRETTIDSNGSTDDILLGRIRFDDQDFTDADSSVNGNHAFQVEYRLTREDDTDYLSTTAAQDDGRYVAVETNLPLTHSYTQQYLEQTGEALTATDAMNVPVELPTEDGTLRYRPEESVTYQPAISDD